MGKDDLPRLRAKGWQQPLRIVLVEPEIPGNTGSVARIAAAWQCPLHLVGPLGFRIDDKAVRRAGLDYWPLVQVERHEDFEEFRAAYPDARPRLFSAVAPASVLDAGFRPGDALVFGRESTGLPDGLLAAWADAVFAIPTIGQVRSLNLACAVSVAVFEAARQLGTFRDASLAP
ncbi:MAG: tRNA (cytidine(34)-2'-O)-methyltransferase [Deltaproteobacteria bacterium]|jgi:tRNA (cytidine/uridine-2'-O-)-methyltransferase|nr:tRNA (cytidine(34)-2'-O)-methyltransferase [Deltaproteobacteria bacterium]MBW2533673.1 tRNA (cytidine(34)-2'-O)-methyltransferase [Deltaproteobacteria bacterium]